MADAENCSKPGVLGQRPSRSADTAWHDELERISAMTARERAELALRLGLALQSLNAETEPGVG